MWKFGHGSLRSPGTSGKICDVSVTNKIPKVLVFVILGMQVGGCSFDSMGLPPGQPVMETGLADMDLGADTGDGPVDVASESAADLPPELDTSPDIDSTTPDGALVDAAVVDSTLDGPGADGPPADNGPDAPQPDLAPLDLPAPDVTLPDTMPWPDLVPWPDVTTSPDASVTDTTPPPCTGYICPLGCNAKENRCFRLKPSNFSAKSFFSLVSDVTFTASSVVINTSTGQITDGSTTRRKAGSAGKVDNGIYFGVVKQKGYPEIAVFGVKNLNINSTTTVTVTGSRALAIYATANVFLYGKIKAVASGASAGPGGSAGGQADGKTGAACHGGEGHGGKQEGSKRSGGGGAGRKQTGGSGGKGTGLGKDAKGGAGGKVTGKLENKPLFGGCGGGGGKGDRGGKGGGGGGAVQISTNGTISIDGVIHVGGAGGEGGHSLSGSGGGGGSGGAILLESYSMQVTKGLLAANGGGGGCGSGFLSNAPSGENGKDSTTAAKGGDSFWEFGDGGSGGARSSEGGAKGADAYRAGGGGGAAGRIRVNGLTISIGATNASPVPSVGTKVDKW